MRAFVAHVSGEAINLDVYRLTASQRQRLFGQARLARHHRTFENDNAGTCRALARDPALEDRANVGGRTSDNPAHAAALSSLSAPRMTILSTSSGNGRCSALASSQDPRHCLGMDRLNKPAADPAFGFHRLRP